MGSVLGPIRTSLHEEPALALAAVELGAVPILVAPNGWYNQGGPNDSVIGYDVLAPFVVRIDYPRRRLWLRRVQSDPIRFNGADWALAKQTGAFVNPGAEGHLVWDVRPGSPAQKLGLRPGDRVVSSGGPPPTTDEVLRRILAGEELQVARKQGELWVDSGLPEAPAP
jgi:S1-C subfamily serine protease